jgi:recombination protein RecA
MSKAIDKILDELNKKHGIGTVIDLSKPENIKNVETVTTGLPSLDVILGGGMPKGRILELFGPESSGKTTLALHMLSKAQKNEPDKKVAFLDIENSFDPTYAEKLGVDMDNLLISQPNSGEQALDIMEKLCQSGEVSMIVLDSVAQLVPMAVKEKEIDGSMNIATTARLLSQTIPRISNEARISGTTLIFINQIRMMIGVMYGCFQYNSRVMLPDGSAIKIGKLVNDKKCKEVMGMDISGKIVPVKVLDLFKNGTAEEFIKFKVHKAGGNGKSQFKCTPEHLILTNNGYIKANKLEIGDTVKVVIEDLKLSDVQKEVIIGSLLGDGCIRQIGGSKGRYRETHCKAQTAYLQWKGSFFNKKTTGRHKKGGEYLETFVSSELLHIKDNFYTGNKKNRIKNIKLSPLSLAIWFQDDGSLSSAGNNNIVLSTHSYDLSSQEYLKKKLATDFGIGAKICLVKSKNQYYLHLNKEATYKFFTICGKFIHPSMRYKVPVKFRNIKFKEPKKIFECKNYIQTEGLVLEKEIITKNQDSMVKFDMKTSTSNYIIDGTIVHNSPETVPGGRALKFASTCRIEIRGQKPEERYGKEGCPVKIKIKKNKIGPPGRTSELFLIFGEGFDELEDLLNTALTFEIIKKSGGWYEYNGMKEQGWQNFSEALRKSPEVIDEILTKLKNIKI